MQKEPGTSSEAVRPEPGIARGLWEAPRWAFVAVLVLVGLVGLVAAVALGRAGRQGAARLRRRGPR